MTPEAQQIAIATARGWKLTQINGVWPTSYHIVSPGGDEFEQAWIAHFVPNYLADLNAMRDAETILTEDQRHEYECHLSQLVPQSMNCGPALEGDDGDIMVHTQFDLIHATAAQKAEAFLRTIEKWIETPEPK